MKYAITGHTHGIGNSLFTELSPNCLGFSRENGYDISIKSDRERIVSTAFDCDIFINNAHDSFFQTEMLYDMFTVWKGKDKLIINIGSDTTSGIKRKVWKYSSEKAALDKANEQLSFLLDPCKVSMIRFGYVGTDRIINNYNPSSYITVQDSTEFILDQIRWMKRYRIVDVTMIP